MSILIKFKASISDLNHLYQIHPLCFNQYIDQRTLIANYFCIFVLPYLEATVLGHGMDNYPLMLLVQLTRWLSISLSGKLFNPSLEFWG